MPRRYRKKRRYRRRRGRTIIRSRPGYRMKRQLPLMGFPKRQIVRMRYNDLIELNPGTTPSTYAKYQFKANGLYDPDPNIGGHQPYMRDTWASMYNHYVVLGAKITVNFCVDATSSNYQPASIVGISLEDDQSFPTLPSTLIESGMSKWRMADQALTRGSGSCKLTHTYSTKRFFNVKDVKDNLDRLGAGVNGDPTDMAFFNIWATSGDSDQLDDPQPFQCNVVIDYIVAFSEPKILAQN